MLFNIFIALRGFPENIDYNPYKEFDLYARSVATTLILTIPFYFGYFLTPKLLNKQKRRIFIALAIAFGTLFPVLSSIMDDGLRVSAILQTLFLFAFLNLFLILGVSFRSIFGWIDQKKLHDQLEKQNLKSELSLLKMQMNPHFLFNTLHNIDTLIFENKEIASKSIEKLSDIMRYMLNEAKTDIVDLQKEMDHLENYLSLEKLRLKNEKFLNYTKSGYFQGVKIAPMIMIPFVENAFKHSIDSTIENGIILKIGNENGILNFYCENQFDKSEMDKDKVHGIGLETVKKRLDLIYKNNYQLSINTDNSVYKVNLEINLNED